MPTLAEEDPKYPEKVAAYLARYGLRRLPWGAIVAHGNLVYTTTSAQRTERAALGEVAIRTLEALGVTPAQLEAIDGLPDLAPAAVLAKLAEFAGAQPEPPEAAEVPQTPKAHGYCALPEEHTIEACDPVPTPAPSKPAPLRLGGR